MPLSVVHGDAAGRHVDLRFAGNVGSVEEPRAGVDLDDGGGGVAFEGRYYYAAGLESAEGDGEAARRVVTERGRDVPLPVARVQVRRTQCDRSVKGIIT